MIPPIETISAIAEKILKGTATAEEHALFWKYLDTHDETAVKETLFQADVYHSIPNTPAPQETENRILQQILSATPVLQQETPVVALPAASPKKNWLRYGAAAACLLAVAGYFLTQSRQGGKEPAMAQAWDSVSNQQATPRMVMLADQSSVWLNAQSVLYVSKDYATNREVKVKGEAFFDVAPQSANPFRVRTGAVTTTVLGTSFNVDHSNAGVCQVSLVSGKVKLNHQLDQQTDGIVLLPGETVFASDGNAALVTKTTGVKDIAAWTHGDLVLNQVSLAEALKKISSRYGVSIEANAALLADKEVSGTYLKSQSLEKVLTQVLFIYQLHYKISKAGSILITA